jgi:hypothetical protein
MFIVFRRFFLSSRPAPPVQAVSLNRGRGGSGVRIFLFDRVTKFFKDVEGDFRAEPLTVDAFVSLAKQLGAEVVAEVGEGLRGLAEELGARPRRGERYRRGDLIALVGERVLLLAPAEEDG